MKIKLGFDEAVAITESVKKIRTSVGMSCENLDDELVKNNYYGVNHIIDKEEKTLEVVIEDALLIDVIRIYTKIAVRFAPLYMLMRSSVNGLIELIQHESEKFDNRWLKRK